MKGLEKHTSKAARGNKEEGARRSRQEGLRGGGGLVKGSGINDGCRDSSSLWRHCNCLVLFCFCHGATFSTYKQIASPQTDFQLYQNDAQFPFLC